MARFESGWQIFGFLLGAALVSVAVIEVLKVEAAKRYGEDDSSVPMTSIAEAVIDESESRSIRETGSTEEPIGLKQKLRNGFQNVVDWFKREKRDVGRRKKRSVSSLQSRHSVNPPFIPDAESPYIPEHPFLPDEQSPYPPQHPVIPDERLPIDRADVGGQPPKIEIEAVVYSPNVEKHVKLDDSQDNDDRQLVTNLVIESLQHHRVRNLKQKIAKLNPYDPMVEAILSRFCPKELDVDEDTSFDEQITFEDISDDSVGRYPPFLNNKDEPIFEDEMEVEEADGFRFVCQSYGLTSAE